MYWYRPPTISKTQLPQQAGRLTVRSITPTTQLDIVPNWTSSSKTSTSPSSPVRRLASWVGREPARAPWLCRCFESSNQHPEASSLMTSTFEVSECTTCAPSSQLFLRYTKRTLKYTCISTVSCVKFFTFSGPSGVFRDFAIQYWSTHGKFRRSFVERSGTFPLETVCGKIPRRTRVRVWRERGGA